MQPIMLTEQQLQNLLVFLNRVEYKGFSEVKAISEIMMALESEGPKQGE